MDLPGPPFQNAQKLLVVLPTQLAGLSEPEQHSLRNILAIFQANQAALERELGVPFQLSESDSGDDEEGARWLIGPASCNPALATLRPQGSPQAILFLDREKQLLISDGADAAQIWDTFSLLRSLMRFKGGTLVAEACPTLAEAAWRVVEEVGDSYPSFELRGLDWAEICARHFEQVQTASDPVAAFQQWLAELEDAHTWVRPAIPPGDLPYQLWVEGERAIFTKVPPDSLGWHKGVRPGFWLVTDAAALWWKRTAATPHSRPLVAGRRLLQAEPGSSRELIAQGPDGKRVSWVETVPARVGEEEGLVSWQVRPSGCAYLKIRAWLQGYQLDEQIEAAFEDFKGCERLIVDLRGNGGGDLALAHRLRDRFVPRPSLMGTIRYSLSHRVLSEPEPILAEPVPAEKGWSGPVRFLTDPLTYSASEDALLGLQGLPQVQVVGEASGGGSGRLRVLPLIPGWRLTISTALTYDREGHCIEGSGIPVDIEVKVPRFSAEQEDLVLRVAEQGW